MHDLQSLQPGHMRGGLPELLVGHFTHPAGTTGCTVILAPAGMGAGVYARGSVVGTNEIDLVRHGGLVERIQAIFLSGGSVFGLAGVAGVMRFAEERGWGFPVRMASRDPASSPGHVPGVVPIVAAAPIFDLEDRVPRLDAAAGYAACQAAVQGDRGDRREGAIGVAAGSRINRRPGWPSSSPGGLAVASGELDGRAVSALVVLNHAGVMVDPATGAVVAGAPIAGPDDHSPSAARDGGRTARPSTVPTSNLIAVVATSLPMTRARLNELASNAHDGFARVIRPLDSRLTSSIVFAVSTGARDDAAPATVVGLDALAADLVATAALRAATLAGAAVAAPGIPPP